MTLVYEYVTTDLECVLDEYIAWQLKLTRSLFYPDVESRTSILEIPDGLPQWIKAREEENKIVSPFVKELLALHGDVCAQAQALLAQASVHNSLPDYKTYKSFCAIFEKFSKYLGELEKESLFENNAYDRLTGLKSREAMLPDIYREIDRLERDGKPFAVAMLQIDEFDKLAEGTDAAELDQIMIKVSDMIKLSLRSFDDAYALGMGVFVLTLKQTESDGGVCALERLRKDLEKHSSDGVTLSSCIAEPVPGDDIGGLLNNLTEDLNSHEGDSEDDGGVVMEYYELTPLQRFMKDQAGST